MRMILTAIAFLAAAPAAAEPAPPPIACSILSIEEVQRFIPEAAPRPGWDGPVSDCAWFAEPNGVTIGAALTLEAKLTAEGTNAVAYFDAMIANTSLGPMERIEGIGERAAIQESEGEDARFVYVAAGGSFLILTIIYLPRETAIEIAGLASARMK